MKRAVPLLTLLALAAGAAAEQSAETGTLSWVAVESEQIPTVLAGPTYVTNFTKPRSATGLVSKNALVGRAIERTGTTRLMVALDSAKADSNDLDIIRLDFTGQGTFGEKSVITLSRPTTDQAQSRPVAAPVEVSFGPARLEAAIGEKTVPVTVRGRYISYGRPGAVEAFHYVLLTTCVAAEGKCDFGGKAATVRVISFNSGIKFRPNTWKLSRAAIVSSSGESGAELMVDTGDGKFSDPAKVRRSYLGQPVLVDGKWYTVSVSDDLKAAAQPLDAQTARLRIPHEKWSATLLSEKWCVTLSGGKEPVELPAGSYAVLQFSEERPGAKPDKPTLLQLMDRSVLFGQNPQKTVKAEADKVAEAPLGSPVKVKPSIMLERESSSNSILGRLFGPTTLVANISMDIVDSYGLPVANLEIDGERPAPPKVEITDAQGQKVHSGTLEYG